MPTDEKRYAPFVIVIFLHDSCSTGKATRQYAGQKKDML